MAKDSFSRSGVPPLEAPLDPIFMIWDDVRFFGGTERRMLEVSALLVHSGLEVICLFRVKAPSRGGDRVRAMFREAGVTVANVDTWSRMLLRLGREKPKRLLAFGLRASMVARLVRPLCGADAKHVMARNGLDYGWPTVAHLLDRYTSGLVDIYLTNSRAVANHLRAKRIPVNRIQTVRSALSSEWESQLNPRCRDGIYRVIMVGNSRPEKNQAEGLNAVCAVAEDVEMMIYTNDADALKRTISCNSELPVKFVVGKDVEPLDYDSADILLHPSISESLPRAVLEGVARGIFVIAYDVGDTAEVVDPRRSIVLPLSSVGGARMAESLSLAVREISIGSEERRLGEFRGVKRYVKELSIIMCGGNGYDNA